MAGLIVSKFRGVVKIFIVPVTGEGFTGIDREFAIGGALLLGKADLLRIVGVFRAESFIGEGGESERGGDHLGGVVQASRARAGNNGEGRVTGQGMEERGLRRGEGFAARGVMEVRATVAESVQGKSMRSGGAALETATFLGATLGQGDTAIGARPRGKGGIGKLAFDRAGEGIVFHQSSSLVVG